MELLAGSDSMAEQMAKLERIMAGAAPKPAEVDHNNPARSLKPGYDSSLTMAAARGEMSEDLADAVLAMYIR
jgi:hypothetical protein